MTMLTTPAPAAPPSTATSSPAPSATATPSETLSNGTPAAPSQPQESPAPAAQPQSLISGSQALEVPDKFKVTREDGTLDHEATLQKALGSVVHLEKRLGSGDVPPENEAGYKLDYSSFPEGITINPEGEKALLKSLHAAGMTNKQVQTVITKYGEVIKQGIDIQKAQEAGRASETLNGVATELKASWGENFGTNQAAAIRGFNHLADETDKADLAKIGIDGKATYRILMKVLAKVGAGITEDRLPAGGDSVVDTTLDEIKASKAYLDASDPGHNAAVQKAAALYQKKFPKK